MDCPSCRTPVAGNARVCPKCGHRFTHPFVMVLAGLFALFLVAMIVQVESNSPGSPPGTTSAAPRSVAAGPTQAVDPKKKAIADRKEYAHTLQGHLLSIGLDAHVKVVGKEQDTLRISWAAMSRPIVYNMITGEGMTSQAPQLGFRKVIFTDDGSFSGLSTETWTYRWNGTGWQQ